MVFSQEWVNGNIRGNLIGKIPNDLLLLCLVSNRFVRASEQLLQGVTRDLQVYDIVKEGLKDWGLDDDYPRVSTTVWWCLQTDVSIQAQVMDSFNKIPGFQRCQKL
jgi:hypothetical protein